MFLQKEKFSNHLAYPIAHFRPLIRHHCPQGKPAAGIALRTEGRRTPALHVQVLHALRFKPLQLLRQITYLLYVKKIVLWLLSSGGNYVNKAHNV